MPSSCGRNWVKAVAKRRAGGAQAVAQAAAVLGACLAFPAGAATFTVTIEAMLFAPPSLTVRRGDTVVWVNKDLVPHTATAAKAFDSGNIAPDKQWSYVARKPGRQAYVCTLHPTMKATLIVE